MKEYILIFLTLIFADNILFTKMLGLEFGLVLRNEKKLTPIFWAATIGLSTLASTGAQMLGEKGMGAVVCGAFFPIIGVLGGFVFEFVFKKEKNVRTFALALAINTSLLGIAFSMTTLAGTKEAFISGISHGVGLMLSAVMMNCIEERVKYARPPKLLGKTLLTLLCVGLVAMVFSAFDGFELRFENFNS